MKDYKLAIVGATGLVGRTALKVLEELNLPISEYVLFSSSKSAGSKIRFQNKDYIVQELTEESFKKEHFDFAIFSAGASTSKKFAPIAASTGCIVIDNSSAFRMDEDVPLVVPEVNPEEILKNKGIIANPNCSTIQAVVVLKPLDDAYKIKRIVYSTYQAVSGAGKKAINDYENGIQKHINKLHTYNLEKFDFDIFDNCIPQIDVFEDNLYTKEEMKMINETRKILKNPDLSITATAVRVPVSNCHGESINIEFEKPFYLREVINILKSSIGVRVKDTPQYPMPIDVSGHNNVYVGRIRRDNSINNGLNLWVVADNIRKGAATNAVQILKDLICLQ